ncbi:MAG: DinB family protein [Acidobacteria bacterium]|nr:DinB family protein [Acidobacteriota bacterium]
MPSTASRILRGFLPLALLVVAAPAAADPMTAGDRQRLVSHLEMTESWLVSELAGLSDAQLSFRPSPTAWSIKDVVEHLGIAEPQYWKQLEDSLQAPAAAYKAETTDAAILWYGIDRTNRTTTGDARVPDGRFKTAAEALASFRTLRATMLEKARVSQDDFRGRKLISGNMDVYQWFLMISSHAQRHILQIREVKAGHGFPATPTGSAEERR